MKSNIKTYSDLIQIPSFIERYRYLRLGGKAGEITFGNERYLNQRLYRSPEWKRFRRDIIIRDNGYDLGMEGYSIQGKIIIHHINPITIEDLEQHNPIILDPENAISTIDLTHKAIHYGDESILTLDPVVRKPFDTCPWRQ